MPTTLLLIPRIFRPTYGPVSTYSLNCGLIILEKFISPVLQISLQIWFSSVLPVVHCKSRRVQKILLALLPALLNLPANQSYISILSTIKTQIIFLLLSRWGRQALF